MSNIESLVDIIGHHHFSAERFTRSDSRGVCGTQHHNFGGCTNGLRRERCRDRMIACAHRGYTELALLVGQAVKGSQGPARFESSCALQKLQFRKYLCVAADGVLNRCATHDGCAHCFRGQAIP